ncbi:glycoside hydrolase family 3 protein [Auraticoccus sp. F435]|uniref:beta-N-acetylhexosaminidase n=1 Tax=Auraticoccus cholistanensis TaxID=2656650 RepID=A0A6A9UW19_9ACTN|nr:glycoside hydrolase family 3 protein [Auraticoccus cholistanensis]MVA75774.1 glycoside hydrolase family 3 protein [Auraticoccus cholistanensis]
MRIRPALGTVLSAAVVLAGVAVPVEARSAPTSHSRAPAESCEELARTTTERMSLKHKIGQLVMSQPTGRGLPDRRVQEQLQEWGFGTWIIQNRGGEAANVARYTNRMQTWAARSGAGVPLFIGADMENGVEQQVPDATGLPYPMGLGATRRVEDSALAGRITGAEAAAVGLNWNFSPVVDVNTNPANPVIGVRSFGEEPGLVAEHGAAYTVAMQQQGVLASAKHFPGHGDTSTDSHLGLPSVTYDRQTLEDVHLRPFQEAVDAGVDSLMTAHVVVEAVDPELPATLSPKVLTGLLRGQMGFQGLIITDGMGMRAIADNWGTGEAGVMAIQAGADVILAGGTAELTAEALHQAVLSGELGEDRIDESVRRILTVKCDYGLFERPYASAAEADRVVGNPAHLQAATGIGHRSITQVHDDGVLPLPADQTVAVVGPERADEVAALLVERGTDASAHETSRRPDSAAVTAAVAATADADVVVATTFTFSTMPAQQRALLDALLATGKPVVVVSLGIPYDLAGAAEADAALATYALNVNAVSSEPVLEALADVLVGDAEPGGRLPVTVGELYPYGTGAGQPAPGATG